MRVSFLPVFSCFQARKYSSLGIGHPTIQVGLAREASNRSVDENRTIFVIDTNHISAPAGAILGV